MRHLPAVAILALPLAAAAGPLFAQGGPPLITDDPDTPGPAHWEINLSVFHERARHDRVSEAPRVDLNYGVGRHLQLKLETPYLSRRADGGPAQTGLGNTVAGVKWRFRGEEAKTIAWSVYPQYEFNTSHAAVAKGLVEDGHALLLPSELTLELHPVEIDVEVGRNIVSGRPDEWVYGLATEASVGHRLELLGEVHGETAASSATEWILNTGARYRTTRQLTLMLAAGHAIAGPYADRPRLLVYAGAQLNLPDRFDFTAPIRRRGH